MRPLCLKMAAFGAFADTQNIDFRLLGDRPLFLINGATGSGKTTILDAICYALYGETTGNERRGREMRCDHAQADLLTVVELDFQLSDRHYRIQRIPRQERPRSRGEGTTIQQPEAQLWELSNQGEEKTLLVAKKVKEATARIVRLTGLSAEQFRQVMVLPQGRFRELLLADSKQRETLFRQLFQTRIYTRLEERLKTQAGDIVAQIEQLEEQKTGILGNMAAEDSQALSEEITALKQQLKERREQQNKAEQAVEQSRQQLFEARSLQQQFEQLKAASIKYEALCAQQQQLEADKFKLHLAEKAAQLQPLRQRFQQSIQQWQDADEKAQQAVEEYRLSQTSMQKLELVWEQLEEKQPELEGLKQHQQKLSGYVARAAQLAEALQQQKKIQEEYQQSKQQEQDADNKVQNLRQQLNLLEKRIQQKNKALQQLPDQQQKRHELQHQLRIQQGLEKLQGQQQQGQQALGAARQLEEKSSSRLQGLQQQQKLLEQAWEQEQTALLAAQLQAGTPCPVCGSKEHPHPAQSGDMFSGDTNREMLREKLQLAQQELQNAKTVVAAEEAKLHALSKQHSELLQNRAGLENCSARELQEQLAAVDQTLHELLQTQQQLQDDTHQHQVLKQQLENAEIQWRHLQESRNKSAQKVAAAEQNVQGKQAELPQQYAQPENLNRDLVEVAQKITDLQQQLQQASSDLDAAQIKVAALKATQDTLQQELQERDADKKQRQHQWQSALAASDFGAEQEFLRACMTDDIWQQLAESVRLRDDALLAAKTSMQEKQTLLEGKIPPELDKLQQYNQQLENEYKHLTESRHRMSQQLQQLETAVMQLQKVTAQQNKLHQKYALLGRLADVANGKNPNNLSLHRFVLSVLLDDVLISARQRLLAMSKGRYQLLRQEEVSDRRRGAGLDLVVEDAFSGKSRPVATLSGGESFMAALALALGLSEVVQAYSGGIRLDALFIDEGFGSLDPESLDLAINTLLDLQSGGRMVGIISHVPELKERIDVRLDIETDRSGSRVSPVLS